MAFVLVARLTARSGEEERVGAELRELARHSREEPGCRIYEPNRDVEDPRVFLIYEQYADREAFEAHGASEHFKRHGVEGAFPLLESRERTFYETLDA